MAHIKKDHIGERKFEVSLLGEKRPATLLVEPAYDPKRMRMRLQDDE